MQPRLYSRSLWSSLRTFQHSIPSRTLAASIRHSSDLSHLQSELPSRRLPLVYDYLVPTPSHLLDIAISDVLGPSASTTTSSTSTTSHTRTFPHTTAPTPLPPAHHLIYFPPPIPGPLLLPDGTDPLQSPGPPFVRRMWAGGAVRWNPATSLPLDGARAVCIESIRDVAIKGGPGSEKIFVGIERRVGVCTGDREEEEGIRKRLAAGEGEGEEGFGEAAVVERRNIVFMRERGREQALKDMELAKSKMLRPPEGPRSFDVTVRTDPRLLFRFSALTYNAHAIHLDPGYCREVEGHRGLLVHGPLSFTLLMTLLRRHLREAAAGVGDGTEQRVVGVEYRNLSPLYCGEALRLSGREKEKGKWEIWAETPEGGIALKGTVRTEVGEKLPYGDLAMMGL